MEFIFKTPRLDYLKEEIRSQMASKTDWDVSSIEVGFSLAKQIFNESDIPFPYSEEDFNFLEASELLTKAVGKLVNVVGKPLEETPCDVRVRFKLNKAESLTKRIDEILDGGRIIHYVTLTSYEWQSLSKLNDRNGIIVLRSDSFSQVGGLTWQVPTVFEYRGIPIVEKRAGHDYKRKVDELYGVKS